jgi:hypothetical protein
MIYYEEFLDRYPSWAIKEGSIHFERASAVHKTLEQITRRLDELGISYAVAGAMALFFHGYRRFTERVDILVTPDGLKDAHERLAGRGYLPAFEGNDLFDMQFGVRIEFLVTGGYPGDGKPKPVAFPSPDDCTVEVEGMRFLQLTSLIELKLASGMAPGRRKDLADVQELIRVLRLPAEFAARLHPFVQDLFTEIWTEPQWSPSE